MIHINTDITVGASAPFTLIHVSDTHLTLADRRDGERKVRLSEKRTHVFPDGKASLDEISAESKRLGAPIIHTGDLIDFVSRKNLEYAKKFVRGNDVLLTAGNHEFSLYVGEAFEDEAYRNRSFSRVQACFSNDIRFFSRVINGVNLIGVDDSYYRFDKPQLDALKREVRRGLPIILFMHCALFEDKLCREIVDGRGAEAPYLTCPPPSALKGCSDYRVRQQAPDDITVEATEYIKSEPLIKAIFTGHIHWDWDGMITDKVPQYITGIETIRYINVK